MALTPEELEELSQIIDARSGVGRNSRPKLRLIIPPTPKLLDSISRDAHLRRILHLKRAYRLDWLVDQETFDVASVSCLEDYDLIRLLGYMERARECISENISFDDAKLVRTLHSNAMAEGSSGPAVRDPNAERTTERASIGMTKFRRQPEIGGSDDESPF